MDYEKGGAGQTFMGGGCRDKKNSFVLNEQKSASLLIPTSKMIDGPMTQNGDLPSLVRSLDNERVKNVSSFLRRTDG